jgi:hypothetical protein
MLVCPKCDEATRVGVQREDDDVKRVAKIVERFLTRKPEGPAASCAADQPVWSENYESRTKRTLCE